jgi:uncharacterized protein YaiI (UPF0178 family)
MFFGVVEKNINPCFQLLVNYGSIYKHDAYNDSLFTQCIMQNFGNEGKQVQNAKFFFSQSQKFHLNFLKP